MSAEVIRRIHRLRKHKENEARLAWAVSERERQAQESVVVETNDAMKRAAENVPETAEDLSYQQTWAVRMEMVRRNAEARLFERTREVSQRRDVAVGAAKEARVVELVAEAREAAQEQEERRRSSRALDEIGINGWLRARTT